MKKLLISLFAVILLAGCGSGSSQAKLKDGIYAGTGNGKGGILNLEVFIKDGKIADIVIGENEETPTYLDEAATKVVKSILDKQSTNGVEVVSGATLSSDAIINAVNEALKLAE